MCVNFIEEAVQDTQRWPCYLLSTNLHLLFKGTERIALNHNIGKLTGNLLQQLQLVLDGFEIGSLHDGSQRISERNAEFEEGNQVFEPRRNACPPLTRHLQIVAALFVYHMRAGWIL